MTTRKKVKNPENAEVAEKHFWHNSSEEGSDVTLQQVRGKVVLTVKKPECDGASTQVVTSFISKKSMSPTFYSRLGIAFYVAFVACVGYRIWKADPPGAHEIKILDVVPMLLLTIKSLGFATLLSNGRKSLINRPALLYGLGFLILLNIDMMYATGHSLLVRYSVHFISRPLFAVGMRCTPKQMLTWLLTCSVTGIIIALANLAEKYIQDTGVAAVALTAALFEITLQGHVWTILMRRKPQDCIIPAVGMLITFIYYVTHVCLVYLASGDVSNYLVMAEALYYLGTLIISIGTPMFM